MAEAAPPQPSLSRKLFSLLQTRQQGANIVLACVVGLLVGVVAIGFHELLHLVQRIALGSTSPLAILPTLPWYWKLCLPAIGGLLVTPIVTRWAVEAKGHGVPEVMEAVALRGGIIRARVALAKAVASAVTIGTGGSTGREGPVIQIGSALGSSCGQLLRLSPDQVRTLVGCGAAGGIAATFNAPIAGAFFALEVILGNFAVPAFAPIVLSSVLATAVSRAYMGNVPAFQIPQYSLVHYGEVPLYALLGILMGLVAVIFIRVLYKSEDLFENSPIPPALRTTVGGLLVGVLLLYWPEVYGTGFEAMYRLLHEATDWQVLALLFGIKLIATCTTLGSGASGGIFSPSLFLGVVAGGLFGQVVHAVLPGLTAEPEAYAMVGMGAVVAGTTHAPVTAILMLFELTGDYHIILPVMVACTLSTVTARYLYSHSIYTLKLARKGISLLRGREETVMQSFQVADVMRSPAPTLPQEAPFQELVDSFLDSQEPHYYLVDHEARLSGVIHLHDIKGFLSEGGLDGLIIARDVAHPVSAMTHPGETLAECLEKFSGNATERLPVVDSASARKVVGVVAQQDVIDLYNREVLRKEFLGTVPIDSTQRRGALTLPPQYTVVPLRLPPAFSGRTLKDLDLRAQYDVTVLAVRTPANSGSRDYLPQPDQPLQATDTLILAGHQQALETFQRRFSTSGEIDQA